MAHSFTNLLYHIIFATKDRQPWLDEILRPLLFGYLGDALTEDRHLPLLINGMPEHVHILAKLRPDQALSDVLRNLKARSSGYIHRTRADLSVFAWQVGYGAFTVSQSQLQRVRTYIRDQEEHHRTMPFDLEIRRLARAHGLKEEERFSWE